MRGHRPRLPFMQTMNNKIVISTSEAPSAIGPYSEGIRAGNLLFVSGQIPIDPSTGTVIEDGGIKAQTDRVLENVVAILRAAGGFRDSVVRAAVFLRDLNAFS